MATYLYCYASGLAKFGSKVPLGAIIIDKRTKRQLEAEAKKIRKMRREWSKDSRKPYPPTPWKKSMRARMRLGYDGRNMLVPGIPEAKGERAKLAALKRFKKWAVK